MTDPQQLHESVTVVSRDEPIEFMTRDEIKASLLPMRDPDYELTEAEMREDGIPIPKHSGHGWQIETKRALIEGKIRQCKVYRKVRQ